MRGVAPATQLHEDAVKPQGVFGCPQARDLRLLDAAPASSPPAVLARDKAIIVNLEFIKCIITTGAQIQYAGPAVTVER